jgi:signal transduction histidine kinase
MKSLGADYFDVGPRLALLFGVLIAVIIGGNGLVIWQFHLYRAETDRLTGANRQLITVLQLQATLLSFHQQLEDLARSGDAARLTAEAEPLREVLRDQARQTRKAIADLPGETPVDPAFLPILEAVEASLPAQLDAIDELAKLGDWGTVQRRLGNELKPIEGQTSVLVDNIDQEARNGLTRAAARMRIVQESVLIIVPATAISTVLIAVFFGWAIARRMMELRLEERVNERIRIAGEIHDTLLQSFQGSMYLIHAAHDMVPARPAEAVRVLERVLQQVHLAIAEGRNSIRDIRSSTEVTNDLARAVTVLGAELASEDSAKFLVVVHGSPRDLHPIIRDEIYCVAREAARNAFRHAQARRIDAEITYGDKLLRLRIRDDGCGMDQEIVDQGHPGHYGLSGMRERATRIGAQLKVRSAIGAGTEVELSVPGRVAYGTRLGFFRKKAARAHD